MDYLDTYTMATLHMVLATHVIGEALKRVFNCRVFLLLQPQGVHFEVPVHAKT